MQTIWFPVPVAALFRRLVNVVSTISISQQYLQPTTDDAPRSYALRWPKWLSASRTSDSQVYGRTPVTLSAYTDTTSIPEIEERDTSSSSRCDQIHQLINNPALYDPLRKPRYPIVLCHGECSQGCKLEDDDANIAQGYMALTSEDRLLSHSCSNTTGLTS